MTPVEEEVQFSRANGFWVEAIDTDKEKLLIDTMFRL